MSLKEKLTVSASPHVRSPETTTGIMLDVIISLIPALAASVWLFGPRTLLVTATTVLTCMVSEFLSRKIMKRQGTLGDLSAIVTGILLAFNLPATIPLWVAAIGSVVAIVVVKQFFGGIGQNFVNPALVGRIVLMASFPTMMSTWVQPFAWRGVQVVTTASPLASISSMFTAGDVSTAAISSNTALPSLWQMLIGQRQGSLGEVCALALLLGFAYLLIRRVITPAIPLTYIGTVAVIMLIAGKGSLSFVAYEILGGGLLLGAIFMATDYTTSPINFKGKLIYGVGCGILTALIRLFGSLPEGVSFSIIIMNILVPHIERLTTPKPFGSVKEPKEKTEEKGGGRVNQKQKLWKAILIPTVSLFLICVVSTVLLAVTNSVTAPMIEDLAAKTAAETRQTVLSAAKRFSDPKTVTMDGAQYTYYEGFDGDTPVGYVFTTQSKGYGGAVEIMTGIDLEGRVAGIQTLMLNETAGLGMNAKNEAFRDQFKGKSDKIGVAKSNPGDDEIQALTGATITSKAVTDAVNIALKLYTQVTGGAANG